MKKLPIGTSDYQVLKQENDYYIDKTKNIIEFFNTSGRIVLMPRPRRFGKTLFQSTLYYFFSNQEKDEEIFKDTYIYNTPFFKEHFGKYPVIFLTFKDARENNFETMIEKIRRIIKEEFQKYQNLDLDKIDGLSAEKKIFENIINDKSSIVNLEDSIIALSAILTKYHKKPTIILIDDMIPQYLQVG